jgi:hypothetical protein
MGDANLTHLPGRVEELAETADQFTESSANSEKTPSEEPPPKELQIDDLMEKFREIADSILEIIRVILRVLDVLGKVNKLLKPVGSVISVFKKKPK